MKKTHINIQKIPIDFSESERYNDPPLARNWNLYVAIRFGIESTKEGVYEQGEISRGLPSYVKI